MKVQSTTFLGVCFMLHLASLAAVAQKPELVVQTGHADNVLSVAFSPDGKLLASGSEDAAIKLWDVSTGQELAALIALGEQDWAVVIPCSHFDASPGGMKMMHWVVGLQPVDLDQFKERYYEP